MFEIQKTPIYLSDMILQLKIAIMPTKINYKVFDPRFGTLHVLYLILKEFKVLHIRLQALKIEINSLKC